ncbi:peptidoglycan DD-metalloendopeptidase family protein, partial [Bacillus cereus]|uniref:peptidoglycan DD-metalloendopeptidase family protein n=1 Tax=Bacillus cereus TaxID=1396 RepID=UPI00240664D9
VYGKWYYLDPTTDGSMKTGWVQVHGRWFYLDGNDGGAMKTGWTQVNGRWFYLDAEGAMKTGWVLSNDKWYYLDAEGVMKTGWYQEGEKWFYLDPSAEGAKKVGWAEVNGKWYYLDPTTDGSMKTGWVQVNGKWYYLDGSKGGMMVTGQVVIDGKTYDFANDGQWIESNYQMPIKNPNVSSGYGPRGNKQHKGIDFAAPAGTPILAAKSGTVEFSAFGTQGSFGGYGNVVVLKHADGHYTLYAHMSQRIAQKGEYVQQGQEIGKVGQTGDATGNHLHFELKTAYQFGQINPAPYLPFK